VIKHRRRRFERRHFYYAFIPLFCGVQQTQGYLLAHPLAVVTGYLSTALR
jgi:hypothetical protein